MKQRYTESELRSIGLGKPSRLTTLLDLLLIVWFIGCGAWIGYKLGVML